MLVKISQKAVNKPFRLKKLQKEISIFYILIFSRATQK